MSATPSLKWFRIKNGLPNLWVLKRGEAELGFITKPNDTATDKNAWRLHKGIGQRNTFLGHEYNIGVAKTQVERECTRA